MSDNETNVPNSDIPAAEPSLPVPVPVTPASYPPPAAPASYSAGRRPTGVTVIAVLSLISGFMGLCCGSPLILLGAIGIVVPTGVTQVLGVIGIVLGLLLAIGPLLQIIFAYGAWNLRSWAWVLGIVATGISVLGVIISIIGSGGATIWTAITNALIPIIVFVYLLMPDIRKSFSK